MKKEKSGSKKKKGWIIGSVAAVLVIVAAMLVLFAPKIVNAAMRKFASPEEYYRFVEKKSAKTTISLLGEAYEGILERYGQKEYLREETELTLTVGDGLRKMFSVLTETEFPDINNVGISLQSLIDGEITKGQLTADISVNEEPFLEGTVWSDFLENRVYAEAPLLLEETVEFKPEAKPWFFVFSSEMYKLQEGLPEKKQAEKIVNRYAELVVNCIDQVNSEESEIRAGNVKGEYLSLVVTVDEKTVNAMKKAVMEELQADKELEQLLRRLFLAAGSFDDEAAYDEFLRAVESFFDDCAEQAKADEDGITMTVWVDNSGTVVAREFLFGDGNRIFCAFLVGEKEVGFELSGETGGYLNVKVSLEGEGMLKKGEFSGEIKLKTMGLSVVKMELREFDFKECLMGRPKGTVEIKTTATLNSACKTLEKEKGLPLTNLKAVLELTTDKKGPMVVVSVEGGNMSYGSISYRRTVGKGEKFSIPDTSISSEEAAERFVNLWETSTLRKQLKELGITEEWLETLFYGDSYEDYK